MPPKSHTPSTMNFHAILFIYKFHEIIPGKLFCKFSESKCNPYWGIILTTLYGTNYVLNEHMYFSRYGPYSIPSDTVPWYSYPASLENQNPCWLNLLRNSFDTLTTLMSMKILISMVHLQYHWENAMSQLSCKFGESKWNPYSPILLTSSSNTNYVPNEHAHFDQYDPFDPSDIMICSIYPESMVNQHEIPVDLMC